MSPPRRRLPVPPPWLPRPRVCPRLHLHRITSKGYPPARVLTAASPCVFCQWLPVPPLHREPLAKCTRPTATGTRADGSSLSGYFSTPIFPHFIILLLQRRTRRTRRAIVSSARTLEARRANTHRRRIHARRGVTDTHKPSDAQCCRTFCRAIGVIWRLQDRWGLSVDGRHWRHGTQGWRGGSVEE